MHKREDCFCLLHAPPAFTFLFMKILGLRSKLRQTMKSCKESFRRPGQCPALRPHQGIAVPAQSSDCRRGPHTATRCSEAQPRDARRTPAGTLQLREPRAVRSPPHFMQQSNAGYW